MQCSPRLCSLSVWPCSPLGCTGARSSWGPDCGSTIPALVMVLCGKASPVLTGVDKGCEIVNETLPLLLPVNIINQKKKKKSYTANYSSWQLRITPGNMVLCGHGCSSTLRVLNSPVHKTFLSCTQLWYLYRDLLYLTLWGEEWCQRKSSGPLSILDRACDHRVHPFDPAVSTLRTMDCGKSTDTSQKGGLCWSAHRTTTQSICVCVCTVHHAPTAASQATVPLKIYQNL